MYMYVQYKHVILHISKSWHFYIVHLCTLYINCTFVHCTMYIWCTLYNYYICITLHRSFFSRTLSFIKVFSCNPFTLVSSHRPSFFALNALVERFHFRLVLYVSAVLTPLLSPLRWADNFNVSQRSSVIMFYEHVLVELLSGWPTVCLSILIPIVDETKLNSFESQ